MCVNYIPPKKSSLQTDFRADVDEHASWPEEVWQDYSAPILRTGAGGGLVASVTTFGMVPKRHIPEGVRAWSSMNARCETIGSKRTFAPFWRKGQFCLVPMTGFFEPNWESGKAERWHIGMTGDTPFAVAGLWRSWDEPDGGQSQSFTMLTINANEHPLLKHYHKPAPPKEEEDKRSLVIVPQASWDDWLTCRDPEVARSFLQLYPAEKMLARPAPKRAEKKITYLGGIVLSAM